MKTLTIILGIIVVLYFWFNFLIGYIYGKDDMD